MSPLFPQMLLDVNQELIVDLFAGGGGASAGIEMALGRQVDHAVNHDAAAVSLHEANHPQTQHHRCDVFEVDPREVTEGRPVGVLWASPDCTYHSKARGGKPIRHANRKRRALAWVVTRWAGQVRPRVIMLENVEEFVWWGPLVGKPDQLRPCQRRRGRTFRTWRRSLERLGYAVEHRELRACDYGAPTIRKRLFVVARCDGKPIVWPEPTHGAPGSEGVKKRKLKPFRTAAECIDWSIPMLSIFATREEARDWGRANGQAAPVRPLADATMRRIARGVKRYVLDNPKPYIVGVGGRQGQSGERPVAAPFQTITAKADSAVVSPIVVPVQNASGTGSHPGGEPLRTITAHPKGGGFALAAATMIQTGYGEREGQAPRALDVEAPIGTLVGSPKHGLVAAFLAKHFTGVDGALLDVPAPTVTTVDHSSLVVTSLERYRISCDCGHEFVGTLSDRCPSCDEITSGYTNPVAANLTHQYTSNTTGAAGDPEYPLKTQTTGNHAALVYSFLQAYYGTGDGSTPAEPTRTIVTKDRFGLVTVMVGDVPHVIADIAMRMLQPRELYNAQGFYPTYQITCEIWDPKRKRMRWLTKTEQVRMVGNSVSPPLAAALARANVPEMIVRDEARRSA